VFESKPLYFKGYCFGQGESYTASYQVYDVMWNPEITKEVHEIFSNLLIYDVLVE